MIRTAVAQSVCTISPLSISATLACLLLVGCSEEEKISQYEVAKLPQGSADATSQAASASEETRPERLLGGIAAGEKQMWFFKLTGQPAKVAAVAETFQKLMESVRFDGPDKPAWKLPENWTEAPGAGMRFATLRSPGPDSLEVSVIPLGLSEGDQEEQILANVNRWRDQVGLAPIDAAQLKSETKAAGIVQVVDYEGMAKADNGMQAPFAGGGPFSGGAPFAGNAPMTASPNAGIGTTPETEDVAIQYQTPEGWKELPAGGLRKAAFEVRDGDQRAEITIIALARAAGDRLSNVNRWRGQVGLPPFSADELAKARQELPMGELKGDFYEIVGDEKSDLPQSILGVIVEHGDSAWFIKLQGPSALTAREVEHFRQFASSVRFGS